MMDLKQDVAIYARYSSDKQDARSIDDQIRRCRAFAQARGWNVAGEFKDEALSGAHLERPDLQLLLAEAPRRGRRFVAVLVDDLSRLSRDLGATWRIIFEELASAGVRVIDCNTGISSDDQNARLVFGATALVNDTFLQLVKTETHRGLEGRALQGFWPGGRVFGYATVIEPNPPDPEHPRKVPVVNEGEARIVRRIFEEYVAGKSGRKIAAQLNAEGMLSPYGGTRWAERRRGWAEATIGVMLTNERYIGQFIWNKSKWIRLPGKKTRRRIMRPPSEWKRIELPALAIVPRQHWDLAQARIADRRRAAPLGGRSSAGAKYPHLLSGLLKCGSCGASMIVIGTRLKNGRRYSTYGCGANRTKGEAICPNRQTISEKKISEAVIGALRDLLLQPGLVQRFVDRFTDRVQELQKASRTGDRKLEADVEAARRRVRNVTESLAKVGYSKALADQLNAEEDRLRTLEEQKQAQRASARQAQVLPHPSVIEGYLRDLVGTLEADPDRGRETLARHVGPIVLTPKAEGPRRLYLATGAFDMSKVLENESCGGPLSNLPQTRVPIRARTEIGRAVA